MLSAIIEFSLRFRAIVYVLAAVLTIYGLYALVTSRVDVFPEFAPPMAVVQTEAPGLSSEQVETLVTRPVEDALAGTTDVTSMRSKSLQGLSVVSLVFSSRLDVWQARQIVNERLSAAATGLPTGVQAPRLLPLTTSTSVILTIGLSSSSRSLMDLHDTAQWMVRPQLLSVPGVADAIVFGGVDRQFQIQVDPAKLVRHDLSINDVIAAAKLATGVRGAGFVENANQRILVNVDGQQNTPSALAGVVLKWSNGAAVKIGDVAKVTYAGAPPVGAASVMGKPAVMIVVESQYGGDTLTVTKGLDRVLTSLKPELTKQGIILQPDVFRSADFITRSMHHLQTSLLVGALLVVITLFAFLLNARTALISATAIPLSILIAVIGLDALGMTLNTMTLGGLAIALGEVVDDAIIDVENIYRRLREATGTSRPFDALNIVLRASSEVRNAVVFATLIVITAFVPVLSLSGVAGKLFAPLGVAYILAVVASLTIAVTLTPAVSLALLANRQLAPHEPRLLTWLKSSYMRVLAAVERHARPIIVAVTIAGVAALGALPFLQTSYIPELKEGHYIVHVGLAPGTSLEESMRIGGHISKALMAIPGVRLVAQRAGRADEVVDPVGVQLSEFEIDLKPLGPDGEDRTVQQIRSTLARFPGITTSVNTFLVERIDETISGTPAPVVISVFGNDLDNIDRVSLQIAHLVASMRGAVSVQVESPPGTPELSVRLDQARLSRWGFTPIEVMDAIQSAYQGVTVAQEYQGVRSYDVSVVTRPADRKNISQVGSLLLRNPDGLMVPLRDLAQVRQVSGRYQITHDGGRRVQVVSVTAGGRSIAGFVSEAQRRVDREITMPKGTYAVFSGESEALGRSQRDLLVYGLVAGLGVILFLFLALKSRRAVGLVMFNMPFALVGGVASVMLTGGSLSLGGMVGFVTLFGISLRNSIMLVSHYQHLVEKEGMLWGLETAVRGASERLVPILMTAIVTALALLPLAITSGEAGNEIEGPMAIVILGGLVTSTLLNLFVLPTLALRYGRLDRAE